jgi:hypothetical protein
LQFQNRWCQKIRIRSCQQTQIPFTQFFLLNSAIHFLISPVPWKAPGHFRFYPGQTFPLALPLLLLADTEKVLAPFKRKSSPD